MGRVGGPPASIELQWTNPYVVDRIVLYDRPNSTDQIWWGTINFSDGSTVSVGNLNNNGAGVIFDSAHNADFTPSPKTITSLTFNITSASGTSTGLAEIMVYGLPILTVTATPGSNGTLDPSTTSPASIVYGNTTAFKFNANTNYHVATITDGCGGPGYSNTSNSISTYTYTTPAITAACTVSATFAINQYTLTYTPGANGSISGTSPQTVNYGGSGTQVTAVPAPGYHFVQWSDLSTTNPRTDTNVTANITVTASFAINTYTVTGKASGNGTGSVSSNTGGISYSYPTTSTGTTTALNYGTSVVLTGAAGTGSSTASWGGTCTSAGGTEAGDNTTTATCTFGSLTGTETATVGFTLNQYTVTGKASGNGTGSVSSNTGGISYSYPTASTGTTTALNYGTSVVLTGAAGTGSRRHRGEAPARQQGAQRRVTTRHQPPVRLGVSLQLRRPLWALL